MRSFHWHSQKRSRSGGGASRKRLERGETTRRLLGNEEVRHPRFLAAVAAVLWGICCVAVLFRRAAPPVHHVVGEIADRNIYSEVPFRYADMQQTERLRERAARQVPPVYRLSTPAVDASLQMFQDVMDELAYRYTDVRESGGQPILEDGTRFAELLEAVGDEGARLLAQVAADTEQRHVVREAIRDGLNAGIVEAEELETLKKASASVGDETVVLLNDASGAARETRIRVADLPDVAAAAHKIAREAYSRLDLEGELPLIAALETLLNKILRPTMVYSPGATEEARRKAVAAIDTVTRFVNANDVLVLRGEVVTREIIDRLRQHQRELFAQQNARRGWLGMIQAPIICLILLVAVWYVLVVFHPGLLADRGLVLLVGVVMALQIVVTRLVTDLHFLNSGSSFFLFPLLPLSLGAMLLAPLAGLRAAIVSAVLTTAIAMLQIRSPEAFQLALMGTMSSLVGAAMMRRARRRNHLMAAGVAVFVITVLLQLVFCLSGRIPPGAWLRVHLLVIGYAAVNAFGVTVMVSILLPLLEYAFGATTDMSLLELSDLNHPLLKRLQLEAPGTYHHSLQVATLAEHAAEAIGANPLLARVCAYFHDIGKLMHPEYFIENNQMGVNPHDELQPRMSTLIILNHVRQGMALAKRYKLKRPLREAIAQHHGTSLVYYFYRKAMEQQGGGPGVAVGESEYRYPGPRARRKEIVLVALADSCEAACRSLSKPTPGKIASMVDSIVNDRIQQRELDRANLTFSELSMVRESIVRTLGTMLHARVPYQKEVGDETTIGQTGETSATRE